MSGNDLGKYFEIKILMKVVNLVGSKSFITKIVPMRKTLLPILCFILTTPAFAQWVEQATAFTSASRGITQIVIVDKNTVWATAYDGTGASTKIHDFTVTVDGGSTWTPGVATTPNNNYGWSCLAALDGSTAWAMHYRISGTAAPGVVYKTTDGGTSWTQQGTGQIYNTTGSFPNVIHFWDENTGLAMGDPINNEYEIYTSTDGGTTWNAVSGANIPDPTTGEFGLTASFAVRGNLFWYGTNNGRVFKSADQGNTWEVFDTGYPDYWITEMDFANENMGWVSMYHLNSQNQIDDRQFVRTTDGGLTWEALSQDPPYHYGSFSFVPNTAMTLVCTGIDFTNYDLGSSYSLDGGDTWVVIDEYEQRGEVRFLDHNNGWCGGFNADETTGGIFKYDGSFEATGVQTFETNTTLRLYPNPSNGLFYFSFETENNEPVRIMVTDAIGKVVFEKEYKDKSQTWLRSIDLRSFSKGVYFMNLENNGQHTTQKLVIE